MGKEVDNEVRRGHSSRSLPQRRTFRRNYDVSWNRRKDDVGLDRKIRKIIRSNFVKEREEAALKRTEQHQVARNRIEK